MIGMSVRRSGAATHLRAASIDVVSPEQRDVTGPRAVAERRDGVAREPFAAAREVAYAKILIVLRFLEAQRSRPWVSRKPRTLT